MPPTDLIHRSQPTTVGPYRLLRSIGAGGMGEVYLARRADDAYAKRVAVKIMRRYRDGAGLLGRFRSERQILASLDHPNIARCLDGGQDAEGHPYLVMEYIEGQPIDQYCDGHRLTVEERLRLMVPICSAVQSAHQRLVVHRDIKPANVLVTAEGVPKLLDFGIAKILEPEAFPLTVDATRTGETPLTPSYASPEQLLGGQVGTGSDVYALGVLLYLLLAGQRPREVRSLLPRRIQEVFQMPLVPASGRIDAAAQSPEDLGSLASARRTQPAALRRRLQGDLDMVTAKTLHVEPEQRYESAARLADDLQAHLAGQPVRARPDRLGYRVKKWLARHRWSAGLAASLALMMCFGTVLTALQAKELARQRDQAIVQRDRAERLADVMVSLFPRQDWEIEAPPDLTVRQLLEGSALGLPLALEDEPEFEASLLETVGGVYQNLGLYPQARRSLERAVDLRGDLPADPLYAQALLELGETINAQGEVDLALETLRQALASARSAYGSSSPELVPFLVGAAAMEGSSGDFRRALEWLEEAAFHVEQSGGGTSAQLMDLWAGQAGLLRALGRTGETLRLWEKIYAADASNLSIRFNLAGARRGHGDFEGALAMYAEAAQWMDARDIQGRWRLELPFNRALVDFDRGRLPEAREALRALQRPLRQQLEQSGDSVRIRHFAAVTALYQGYVAAELGEADTAELHWLKAKDWLEGVEDASVWVRHLRVEVLLALGDIDRAGPLAVELLDQGWRYREFGELCARYGIFPTLPSHLESPSLELAE